MTPEPCPECEGRCCRDSDFGGRVYHMGAECYYHWCDACEDGDKYTPPRMPLDERWDVVAYLRGQANAEHPVERGIPSLSPAGRGLLLLHADRIERGEHVGASTRGNS